MSVSEHRMKLFDLMPDDSLLILYSGIAPLANEDEYYNFQVNSNFFYLADYSRAGMILLMTKYSGRKTEHIFIEPINDLTERWTGKMPTADEVSEKSGISDICFIGDFPGIISRIMSRQNIQYVFFDCFHPDTDDMPTYNFIKAKEFQQTYPTVPIKDARNLILPLREVKDDDEIKRIKEAICFTEKGLNSVLRHLSSKMTEYQAQALFEVTCLYEGATGLAFPTISACGINACSMHYEANRAPLKSGSLLLMDLGAASEGYCSDVTRTYPVNGKYSERQKIIYNIVLLANKAVAAKAAPGISLSELEKTACEVLSEGLIDLGLIQNKDEIRKYYMHGVSHSIGINSHDPSRRDMILQPGCIISNEPGLYIDEEEIGIRIEDDLLITETGCEVLTSQIPKEIDAIEDMMSRKL